jgi:Transcriptional regulator
LRSDAEENQQEIMSCAKRLFAEQGVSEVSMNQIAKTLGIGAGTLYRHYANKSALCMALVYDDLAAFVEASRHYLMENKEPAQDQFQSILTRYLNSVRHTMNCY